MTNIILDCCCNHLGNKRMIAEMIKVADSYGVEYIKFQLYDHREIRKDLFSSEYIEFMKECELDEDKIEFIFNEVSKTKMIPVFTLFAFNLLNKIKEKKEYGIKIASCDAMKPWVAYLIIYAEITKTPIFISTGMLEDAEKTRIFDTYRDTANFLSCVSMYPCYSEDIDFNEANDFNGLSCHTNDFTAIKEALLLDLKYLELHFTLGNHLPGKDQKFAIGPDLLKKITDYRRYLSNVERYKERYTGNPE